MRKYRAMTDANYFLLMGRREERGTARKNRREKNVGGENPIVDAKEKRTSRI